MGKLNAVMIPAALERMPALLHVKDGLAAQRRSSNRTTAETGHEVTDVDDFLNFAGRFARDLADFQGNQFRERGLMAANGFTKETLSSPRRGAGTRRQL
jgi:hypothetical protein